MFCFSWPEFPSEGETVAARSKESGVTIASGFDPDEKLMSCVGAAVLMTLWAVLIRHWHTGSRGLAHVERCAVTAEHFHRRPLRQHRNQRRRVWCEIIRRMNNFSTNSTNNSENGFDAFDFLFRLGEVIV